MQKEVVGDFTTSEKHLAKDNYKPVNLRRVIDISEKIYSDMLVKARLNETQKHTLFGDGKVLPVAFERLDNGNMQFLGITTDIQGFMEMRDRSVKPPAPPKYISIKTNVPTHPSATHYTVRYLVPDKDTTTELLKAVEKVSGIKASLIGEEVFLGDVAMRLTGKVWIAESKRMGITARTRIGPGETKWRVQLDSELSSKKEEEKVAVRYTFSKGMKLVKIEARAPSKKYVTIMDRDMKEELVKGIETATANELARVKKEFGEGEDKVVVDYLTSTRGRLMRIEINGMEYNDVSLRPAKLQRIMKEFMARKEVRVWYTKEVAGRKATQVDEREYRIHTGEFKRSGDVVKLEDTIPFAGHEIVSFRFMGNDLVTRVGLYGISVNKDGATVSWIKEEKSSGNEITVLMQLKEDEVLLSEGGKLPRMVTSVVMKDGKPYLKALNAKEVRLLENEKVDVENGLLSIEVAKGVVSDKILTGRHPVLELTNTKLRQILEHEEDIDKVAALYEDARGLQHNPTIEKILEEHLKKKTLQPIDK